ncbi:S24 family peptidase [Paraburkholderia sp. BR10936]|uniref:S24 family peptidase n=1 Tax=Paraburkholderia sp. BR10936 TaxID=3236993 RepID=UPI0034D2DFFF
MENRYERRRVRLLELRDRLCDGRNSSLAKRIGKSDSYITRMLWTDDREGRKRIGEDMVAEIEHALGVPTGTLDSKLPIDTILANRGQVEKDQTAKLLATPTAAPLAASSAEAGTMIPLYSWQLPKGKGAWEVLDWIPAAVTADPNAYYLRMIGPCMHNPAVEPSLADGDLLLIHPATTAKPGDLVIFVRPGSHSMCPRQLVVDSSGQYLRALNPSWPEGITPLAKARIVGRIAAKVVRY